MVDLDCLSGLSESYGGEARVNGDIAPERLSVYKGEVTPSLSGHTDPMKTPLRQHPVAVTPRSWSSSTLVTTRLVKAAPNIEMQGDELSRADESRLYHHYEMNYTAPTTESGRRLVRHPRVGGLAWAHSPVVELALARSRGFRISKPIAECRSGACGCASVHKCRLRRRSPG